MNNKALKRWALVAALCFTSPFTMAACPSGVTQACSAPCSTTDNPQWTVELTANWHGIRPGSSGSSVSVHYAVVSDGKDAGTDTVPMSIPKYNDSIAVIPPPKKSLAVALSVLAEDDAVFAESFFTSCLIDVKDTTGAVVASNASGEDQVPTHAVCTLRMDRLQIKAAD